jgi:hypothetical protein
MSINAFGPRSLTYNIAATQAAGAAVNIACDPLCDTYQFINIGTAIIYFAMGNDATTVAAIPAPGAPANGTPVLPNEIVIYRFSPNAWCSVICDAGLSGNLLVSVGEGI